MRRPAPGEYNPYYQGYIDRNRGAGFLQNLEDSADVLIYLLESLPEEKHHHAYAPGKWTVLQLLRHVIDTDMVFTHRALWLARSGGGDLPGFEEDRWAENSLKGSLHFQELMRQFKDLRNFSMGLFHSFGPALLDAEGLANGHRVLVRSIPFIMAGHTFHHAHILKERYL